MYFGGRRGMTVWLRAAALYADCVTRYWLSGVHITRMPLLPFRKASTCWLESLLHGQQQ